MTQCAVCNKRLKTPSSVSRGTGPVCAKNVMRFIAALQGERAMIAWSNWAQIRNEGRVGVDQMAIANARAQFLARIHKQAEIPVATGSIEHASSARGRVDRLIYERFQNGAVLVHSRSGNDYVITTDEQGQPLHCSCPDHQFRRCQCRHMLALEELQNRSEQRTNVEGEGAFSGGNDMQLVQSPRIVQVPSVLQFSLSQEASTDEERDRNLEVWSARHAHDGVFLSENDGAWIRLREEAQDGMGEYERENVLDGIDNTFGIELEVEGVNGDTLAQALRAAGLSEHSTMLGYSARVATGSWAVKRDGSLSDGAEIVSPVLRDTPETWEQIRKITQILQEQGAVTNSRTGFHIHMGHDVLDDRGYRWQRLGRYMVGYSSTYLQMGAANKSNGATRHRGTSFTSPLNEGDVRQLSRRDNATEAARKMIGYTGHNSRYKMINTAKYIEQGVPTVEFRYPNGTIEAVMVQRQVQLANATLMQAAYLRKDMPGADRLPALRNWQESIELSRDGEKRFRQFLDTLGSHRLRLMATQLWLRGRN